MESSEVLFQYITIYDYLSINLWCDKIRCFFLFFLIILTIYQIFEDLIKKKRLIDFLS